MLFVLRRANSKVEGVYPHRIPLARLSAASKAEPAIKNSNCECGEIAIGLIASLGKRVRIWYKQVCNAQETSEALRTILSKREKVGLFPLSLFVRRRG